ncbi:glutaredoxin, partial [Serratia marcescens]|nr:glutaredoxin [Serratia marcescens]
TDAVNGELSEDDIHLFPLLRSLSIVAGVALPDNVEAYRNRMAQRSEVPLLLDMEQ